MFLLRNFLCQKNTGKNISGVELDLKTEIFCCRNSYYREIRWFLILKRNVYMPKTHCVQKRNDFDSSLTNNISQICHNDYHQSSYSKNLLGSQGRKPRVLFLARTTPYFFIYFLNLYDQGNNISFFKFQKCLYIYPNSKHLKIMARIFFFWPGFLTGYYISVHINYHSLVRKLSSL